MTFVYRCRGCSRRIERRTPNVAACNRCGCAVEPERLPRVERRRCWCGTILSSYNLLGRCEPCDDALTKARAGNRAPLVERIAHWVVATYYSPRSYGDAGSFLAALSEPLDKLCEAFGVMAPDFSVAFKDSAAAADSGEVASVAAEHHQGVGA